MLGYSEVVDSGSGLWGWTIKGFFSDFGVFFHRGLMILTSSYLGSNRREFAKPLTVVLVQVKIGMFTRGAAPHDEYDVYGIIALNP